MAKSMRQKVTKYISGQYGVDPEFPWDGDDTSAVFRHRENKKWFALIMEVRRELLGLSGKAPVACMNLKIDDMFLRDMIVQEDGIIPANPKYYDVESAFAKDDVIDRKAFSFKLLNDEYGIFAVRGPRSVPNSLRYALDEEPDA